MNIARLVQRLPVHPFSSGPNDVLAGQTTPSFAVRSLKSPLLWNSFLVSPDFHDLDLFFNHSRPAILQNDFRFGFV